MAFEVNSNAKNIKEEEGIRPFSYVGSASVTNCNFYIAFPPLSCIIPSHMFVFINEWGKITNSMSFHIQPVPRQGPHIFQPVPLHFVQSYNETLGSWHLTKPLPPHFRQILFPIFL